jgi:hypothetical protein
MIFLFSQCTVHTDKKCFFSPYAGSAGIAAASEAAAAVESAVADGEESSNALQGENAKN